MAEMRTVTQVRMYLLILNPMTDRAEAKRIVAVSDDYVRLVNWYTAQFAYGTWKDDTWWKTFKQGSPIEWYNPCGSLELNDIYPFGHGIKDEWIKEDRYHEILHSGEFLFV